MKKTFTCFSNFFCFLLFLSFSTNLFAQPANDRCENALSVTLAADEANIVYVDGDTQNAEDATAINANYPTVCSGSWYTDDVWFTVSTGATVPVNGLIVQTEVGSVSSDLVDHGMAFYADCNAGSVPIECFSDAPGRRTMEIPPACLAPNSDYLIRIWSAGNQVTNQGTFRIGAYEAEEPFFSSVDIVLWEEDFEGGMGDWTTTTTTDTAEVWRWYAPGEGVLSAFGGSNDLTTSRSACSAKMGLPGGWYQTFMTGNPDTIPPDNGAYIDLNSDLISPSIDLSTTTAPVSLKFDQVSRKLNPNGLNPHMYVSFSYDDGVTWADTIEINSEIAANDPARQTTDKINLGVGAVGSSNVRIKFTYDMDFYYWIIDNIQLIETESNNMQANSNWYAVAHNAVTPRTQLSPIGFMIDVENVGAMPQTNVNLNMTVTNLSGAVVHDEDFSYGTMDGQTIVENQIMPDYYTPDVTAADSYIGTYSVSSDSVDFDDSNNSVSFRFDVSDNTFAREFNENLAGITPADANTVNWTYGVFYHVPNGDGFLLTDVLFNIANADQVVDGNVNVTLYKWEDQNADGNAQANERGVSTATPPITGAIVANGTHSIAAGETDVILVLENWDDDQEPVRLEDNTSYIIACAFTSPAGSTTQIALGSTSGDNNNTDYQAMGFIQESLGLPFYNNMFGSEATFDAELTSGWAWAPRIRMNIEEEIISVEDALDEANKIDIFPNPASDIISLKLELASMFDEGIVKITDAAGKTLRTQKYSNIQNEIFTYDVSEYAAGTYFVQFVSEAGTRTERFSVVR